MARRKTAKVGRQIRIKATKIPEASTDMYLFSAKASLLFGILSINRRMEDKDEGYQRTLSPSRVSAISRYIQRHNVIPTSIVVSFDTASFDEVKGELVVGVNRIGKD